MKLYINKDDSNGVKIENLSELLESIKDFTDNLFLVDDDKILDLFKNNRFNDYADAIAHKNGYKEPLSTEVHQYAKNLNSLLNLKSFNDAKKPIEDMNKLLKNKKVNLFFKLSD